MMLKKILVGLLLVNVSSMFATKSIPAGKERFIDAVHAQDVQTLHKMLVRLTYKTEGKILLVYSDFFGSLLLSSIKNNRIGVVYELVAFGAPLDVCDDEGNSPLHYAVMYASPAVVYALLQAGANKQTFNKHNKTSCDLAHNLMVNNSHLADQEIQRRLINRNLLFSSKL